MKPLLKKYELAAGPVGLVIASVAPIRLVELNKSHPDLSLLLGFGLVLSGVMAVRYFFLKSRTAHHQAMDC